MDIEKSIQELEARLQYIQDVFGTRRPEDVALLSAKLAGLRSGEQDAKLSDKVKLLAQLEDLFGFVEQKLDPELTPMDRVRIVRHPQRITLKDILEFCYDNYTEIGGQDEYSIDPSMVIARAYITRRQGDKVHNQPVMVIGQEKGHGQEFRNGGSVKPWGNAKALQYMKVAETENIPIHTYVFTPGAFPVEDYPGAAQQIARNLYEMAALRVPVIACISEGGSGGAEAIALADTRLMLSHGYYSVISPEGAAAIESGIRQGQRAPVELIEEVASRLNITGADNLRMGYVDRVIQEPSLGARPHHYDFFKRLRQEMMLATDEAFLSVKGMNFIRAMAVKRRKKAHLADAEAFFVRWSLDESAAERLVWRRYRKFRDMAQQAYQDKTPVSRRMAESLRQLSWSTYSYLRYEFLRAYGTKLQQLREEAEAEVRLVANKLLRPFRSTGGARKVDTQTIQKLTELSCAEDGICLDGDGNSVYVSPKTREDKAVTCPNAATHGCLDLWAPDLFGDFAGVCQYCGHHFPMEYQWFTHNVLDRDSVSEFNAEVEAANPLDYPGFDQKLDDAKKKLKLKSSCITYEASIEGIKVVVGLLAAPFRGGTVGAAEGEKFIRALSRARKKHYPFLAYVHGTAGIRIQEGTNGVIQMPRVTMAVRRYIEAGGLYMVLYDTNSYAGPVASFLGCSPYQFSVRSANIGFAGPGVIKETTGTDIPPDYHLAYNALARGHIQGIWDRREIRNNLVQAFQTIGGRNLYYR
ncbi:Acetyl-coenzyme A carboxylase carboxyl transferase subunit beta [Fundidesulfovibrio magnetotacticus]|uniref:Acetyl-coenzyme A carboxylase carboxyl transferase subunits beta/alpha n=1 Tax=Fundidesulfovibrio magnetotacticus TaxID=2730080 RepID=A0A6V8M163_9BACT|nr:carboxyl transferase domain-containing protein [Fundidesulfovibrio magnetotacticus]GFK95696.1 Acetyl-coenzyme A carboxylase carboxyl transferase subunit beta [Fundidesulfovibrio magnetotacticus]